MHNWTLGRRDDHGLLLRSELLAAGESDRSIARAVKRGDLHRVRAGALMPTETWKRLSPEDQHRVRARAVLLHAKCDAALSHGSALLELGVPAWGARLGQVDLTRFDDRAGRRHTDVVQHQGDICADDLTVRNGLVVTSGTRTALDVCRTMPLEEATVAVSGLLFAGETTPELLYRRHQTLKFRPGSLGTDVVLRLADGRPESVAERRTQHLCWKQGLPAPEPQFAIKQGGVEIARLDFAWPHLKVWLEFDGKAKYSAYLRPGESPVDVVLREKRREDLLRRLTGWICVRITWADLEHPERVAALLRAAFASAAA